MEECKGNVFRTCVIWQEIYITLVKFRDKWQLSFIPSTFLPLHWCCPTSGWHQSMSNTVSVFLVLLFKKSTSAKSFLKNQFSSHIIERRQSFVSWWMPSAAVCSWFTYWKRNHVYLFPCIFRRWTIFTSLFVNTLMRFISKKVGLLPGSNFSQQNQFKKRK